MYSSPAYAPHMCLSSHICGGNSLKRYITSTMLKLHSCGSEHGALVYWRIGKSERTFSKKDAWLTSGQLTVGIPAVRGRYHITDVNRLIYSQKLLKSWLFYSCLTFLTKSLNYSRPHSNFTWSWFRIWFQTANKSDLILVYLSGDTWFSGQSFYNLLFNIVL
jgi:hypothetical protein